MMHVRNKFDDNCTLESTRRWSLIVVYDRGELVLTILVIQKRTWTHKETDEFSSDIRLRKFRVDPPIVLWRLPPTFPINFDPRGW